MNSGKLVALAVTQPKRSALLPEVPTFGEAMGVMRSEDFVAWYGILVPARTPREVAHQLEDSVFAVLQRTEIRARLTALGTDLVAVRPAPFAERMRAESKQYAEIIKRFGIRAS